MTFPMRSYINVRYSQERRCVMLRTLDSSESCMLTGLVDTNVLL